MIIFDRQVQAEPKQKEKKPPQTTLTVAMAYMVLTLIVAACTDETVSVYICDDVVADDCAAAMLEETFEASFMISESVYA